MGVYIDDRPVDQRLKVRPYDRAAAWLIALLILIGATDGLMFLLWISPFLGYEVPPPQIAIQLDIAGRGDHAEGYARDKEPPGVEELEEFMEPEVEMLLEAVTDVVSSTAAAWDSIASNATSPAVGSGKGDSRPPGPLGEGEDIIPEWERWTLKYNTTTIEVYAQQLDQFGIELGVIGGGYRLVDYASNFSRQIRKRQGKGSDEKRIYFVCSDGKLKEYDGQLVRKAGIPTAGRIVAQFIPPELRQQLLNLELQYAVRGKNVKNLSDKNVYVPIFKRIRKTIFGVKRSGGKYQFYVISQSYRS